MMPEIDVGDRYQELRQLVAKTLDSVKSAQYSLKSFDRIFELTQCVPMTSSEYQTTIRRAHGALEQCLQAEYGAAAYDLRLLLKSIERVMASEAMFTGGSHVVTRRPPAPRRYSRALPPALRA